MEQLEFKSDEFTRPVCYVRMTPAEFKRLQAIVKAQGKSAPELFKNALFQKIDLERPLYDREHADRIITELKRIGNNINQIAKQFNSGLMTGWSASFNSVVRAFVDLRHLYSVNRANC